MKLQFRLYTHLLYFTIAYSLLEKKTEILLNMSNNILLSPMKTTLLNDDLVYAKYENFYNKNKLSKLFHYLQMLIFHPLLAVILFHKIKNLLFIISERMKGRSIRW